MTATSILEDCFTRIHDSVHRILDDLTDEELHGEPHPSIGWLAWRLTRVEDSNVTRLWTREQLWIGEGWADRFGMPPLPADFGRSMMHTREQVREFSASKELIFAYQDAAYAMVMEYLKATPPEEFDRELDEPQYNPRPTVGVRLISLVENGMQNTGQMGYLKGVHRLGGWFPVEVGDAQPFR